jgi:death-on-curing protein
VRNRALVDGNRRLAWAAAVVFYDLNGCTLDPPSDGQAVALVAAAAAGELELAALARRLPADWARER